MAIAPKKNNYVSELTVLGDSTTEYGGGRSGDSSQEEYAVEDGGEGLAIAPTKNMFQN